MYRLLEFFYQYRAFLFFLLMEAVCIWLIVQNNTYQGAAFFNSSNRYVASILEVKSKIQDYFSLKNVNSELAEENARLKQILILEQQKQNLTIENKSDWLKANRFKFFPAKVINNSTGHFTNYITIDKGKANGITEGMGIIGPHGVVGRIKDCSDHYCTAFSVLHKKFILSAKIKDRGIDCHVKWNGENPFEADLVDVTRNYKLQKGDSVVTSGYNPYFPEGIMIGTVKDVKEEGGSFWKAKIDLSTDFNSLSYVYVIGNKMEPELDSLLKASIPEENR
jgi:rod shape-determining protein MreC